MVLPWPRMQSHLFSSAPEPAQGPTGYTPSLLQPGRRYQQETSGSLWGDNREQQLAISPVPNPSGRSMPLSSLGHVSPAQEPGLILLARVEGLDGGGGEHWAGAHRARGHLHPPNSDISWNGLRLSSPHPLSPARTVRQQHL